jgi:hypothetical protein
VEIDYTPDAVFWLVALFPLPIFLLSIIRPMGRLFFFGAGLLFSVVTEELISPTGPDNPMVIVPVVGVILALDAVAAELCYRVARWAKTRLRAGAR